MKQNNLRNFPFYRSLSLLFVHIAVQKASSNGMTSSCGTLAYNYFTLPSVVSLQLLYFAIGRAEDACVPLSKNAKLVSPAFEVHTLSSQSPLSPLCW